LQIFCDYCVVEARAMAFTLHWWEDEARGNAELSNERSAKRVKVRKE